MKRIVTVLLIITLLCTPVFAAYGGRDAQIEQELASDLKALGLFQGVSERDFDLYRAPSRAEALTILIRLLGQEAAALQCTAEHPFTDVPEWANPYVAYAWENGITYGVSDTEFGMDEASAAQFLTFVLRALGYSEAEGDFSWASSFTLSRRLGLLPDCVDTTLFLRADAVMVSYAALSAQLKDSQTTLAQKLIDAGVFGREMYLAVYDPAALANYNSEKLTLSAEEVYAQCSPAVFRIVADLGGDQYRQGSAFFIAPGGVAVTCWHVIEGAKSVTAILPDGSTAELLGVYVRDGKQDWAVVQFEGEGYPYLSIGNPATVVGGASVYAIGSPQGLENTITAGIVSSPLRYLSGVEHIQISCALSKGSSGGALINKYGEVVGITDSGIIEAQNLNFAIPMTCVIGYDTLPYSPLDEWK